MKIGTKAYFRRLLLAAASPTLKLNRQYRRGVDLLAENAALSFRVGRQDRQTGKPLGRSHWEVGSTQRLSPRI